MDDEGPAHPRKSATGTDGRFTQELPHDSARARHQHDDGLSHRQAAGGQRGHIRLRCRSGLAEDGLRQCAVPPDSRFPGGGRRDGREGDKGHGAGEAGLLYDWRRDVLGLCRLSGQQGSGDHPKRNWQAGRG